VATGKPTYARGQAVSITAAVGANGSPVSGASVVATVTRPNGSATTLSGTTGSSGYVVLTLQLKKRDQTGTYRVAATANVPPGLSSSAGTSFTVQ